MRGPRVHAVLCEHRVLHHAVCILLAYMVGVGVDFHGVDLRGVAYMGTRCIPLSTGGDQVSLSLSLSLSL